LLSGVTSFLLSYQPLLSLLRGELGGFLAGDTDVDDLLL
jgi:hypothetical protein